MSKKSFEQLTKNMTEVEKERLLGIVETIVANDSATVAKRTAEPDAMDKALARFCAETPDVVGNVAKLEKSAESNPAAKKDLRTIDRFARAYARKKGIPIAGGMTTAEVIKAVSPSVLLQPLRRS